MQATITKHQTPIKPNNFPWIGIHNEDIGRKDPLIVLFSSPSTGIILSANYTSYSSVNRIGEYSDSMDITQFTEFNGEITLQN